jgi:hypothetical protein
MVVKQCFSIVTQTLRRRVTLWNKRDTRKAFLTLWYSRSTKNNLYMQEFHLLYSENQTTSAQNILVRHRVKIEKIASSLNTIFLSSLPSIQFRLHPTLICHKPGIPFVPDQTKLPHSSLRLRNHGSYCLNTRYLFACVKRKKRRHEGDKNM